MKRIKCHCGIIVAILIFSLAGNANCQDANPCKTGGQTCYFGVEIDDILCGYSVENYCEGILNDKKVRLEYSEVILKMSALGADIDAGFKALYAIDPVTRRVVRIEINVITGESVSRTITRINGDTAWFSIPVSGINKAMPVGKDIIFATQTWYPHLYNDFIINNATEKKYRVFDPVNGEVNEKGYIRKSEERIVLSDSAFQTIVLEETDFSTGVKTNLWLNKADGFNVKAVVAGRRKIYLADRSVTSKITVANIDNELFARVDRKIPDFTNLSWLRVKAKLNSYGEVITVQSLNFPGQKFEGTVDGSMIEGIFEVQPSRYSGENASSFPADYSKRPDLRKYLESGLMIESDDPLIVSEAVRITAGSKNSWDAAVRLSKWVSENIAGAIPGGISALNTLKTKEAECGGHSRLLAALCRAVGIPARVSVGCMYTAYHSGGFGQHAWTEIYVGDAGWIPVDATISEVDYTDAGHIRLGENATFRPISMEVIDFKTGTIESGSEIPASLKPLLGTYMNIEQYRTIRIIYRNKGLAVDIPGRLILDLNYPDDKGKWYPKLTREISLMPATITDGKADRMVMHQYFRLKKTAGSDSVLNELPDDLRKYAGNYQFTPARLNIDVMFKDGEMITRDPFEKSKDRISYLKTGDTWIDRSGTYEITFAVDNAYNVTLNLAAKLEFLRGEPVTNAVEAVIKDAGIDAGLKKYDELRNSANSGYLFSEHMLHQLGHKLLQENKIDDAIKVFRKNVDEYPGSFMANDAIAEAYMKKGDNNKAIKYFKEAVKLNPEYEYGNKMILELQNKQINR